MEPDTDALTRAWATAQDRLPIGWQLDGLRCASTGMAADQRSGDWVAVAIGPEGQERSCLASDPFQALNGLAADLGPA
jgi:hypothetical protein